LEILLEIVVYFFGFMWPSGRARGRARTKMVGPRPYLVYCWRRTDDERMLKETVLLLDAVYNIYKFDNIC